MFEFTIGDVGNFKSGFQAETLLWLLKRSVSVEKKYKLPKRMIGINFSICPEVANKYKDRIFYWKRPLEMIFSDYPINKVYRRNFDCIWEEMAVELPNDKITKMHDEVRYFFAQHRHRGIQIFGNTQDYLMVNIDARRMATRVYECFKIIGSRDPDPTLPPVKFIWGLAVKWELDKRCIRADDQDRVRAHILPEISFITKKIVSVYSMFEDIRPAPNKSLIHQEYECLTCGKKEYSHIKTG